MQSLFFFGGGRGGGGVGWGGWPLKNSDTNNTCTTRTCTLGYHYVPRQRYVYPPTCKDTDTYHGTRILTRTMVQ